MHKFKPKANKTLAFLLHNQNTSPILCLSLDFLALSHCAVITPYFRHWCSYEVQEDIYIYACT